MDYWEAAGKLVGSGGLLSGMIGAYLIAKTTLRVTGTAITPRIDFGDAGEEHRAPVSGLTGTPSSVAKWWWGWGLLGAGFALQLAAVWFAELRGLITR